MIKSIYLENWKSHLKTLLEFEKGTNVIVGKSGAGKSSVMDAISFALYGTFPSLAGRRVTLDETIMAKPFRQERSTLRLEFGYGGKNYSAERAVKRNGVNEATLREDGRIIAGPKTTDVTKKIEEITEVSYDLFSRAVYSEQNQIDFFLKLSPSQRKEKFDELLSLDRYEKVRTNCVTLSNRIKKLCDDRKTFLAEQKGKTGATQIQEYELRINGKEKEMREKSSEAEKLASELKAKEKGLKEAEENEKEYKGLKELHVKAKSRAEAMGEQITKAMQKAPAEKIGELKKKAEKKNGMLKENAVQKKEIERRAGQIEKELSALKEKAAVQKNLLQLNDKNSRNVTGMGAECPVCKKPMKEHEREKLGKELGEEKGKILGELEKLEKEAGQRQTLLAEAKKELEEHERKKELLQKEAEELQMGAELLAEIAEREKQKEELEKELEKIRLRLDGTRFDEKDLEKKRREYYALRENSSKAEYEISAAKELLQEMRASVQRIRETQERVKRLGDQVKENEIAIEKLSIFNSALKSAQAELRNAMVETVNSAMGEIWQRIYPYGDFSGVKIAVQEGSYEIMVKQLNGEWVRVEGILSGGERNSVALTIRIAISLVLTQNLGWIILDEPTHNLDANSVRELSETMRTHLPEFIEQIFIITHDQEMENAASGKLYELEREKEKDGTTKIMLE